MASPSCPLNSLSLKPKTPKTKNHTTGELHLRNLHRAPYDFPRLIAALPELTRFVQPHPLAGDTIDFSDAAAVLTLNRALLKLHYGVTPWGLPPGFLCPPIPSRADYLHHAADLLAADTANASIPIGPTLRILDIGTGASAIYAFLATALFGWSALGTDIDNVSMNWARQLAASNPAFSARLEFRHQSSPGSLFANVIRPGETFALSVCNPPFHASQEEAAAGTQRKLKNLHGHAPRRDQSPQLNFGGRANELWCPGGEAAFINRMITESAARPALCVWFTTLVSKRGNLPILERQLQRARVPEQRILTMFAGQKQSRVLAWTFLTPAERRQRLA